MGIQLGSSDISNLKTGSSSVSKLMMGTELVWPTTWSGWDGLTAYWRFDEGTGTSLSDQINSLTGSLTTASWSASGKNSNCISVASETYSTLPHSVGNTSFTGNFSFSVWVFPTNATGEAFIMHKAGYPYNYRIDYPNGKFNFACGINGTWQAALTSGTYAINNWYHIAGSYSTSAGKILYVNGSSAATNSSTGTLTTASTAVYVGKYSGAAGYDFNGRIDEIALWNRVITPTEVSELYNSGTGRFY